jgi:hypothetical protein
MKRSRLNPVNTGLNLARVQLLDTGTVVNLNKCIFPQCDNNEITIMRNSPFEGTTDSYRDNSAID